MRRCPVAVFVLCLLARDGRAEVPSGNLVSGKLTQVHGQVWLQNGESPEAVAKSTEPVPAGTRIRTGSDGKAEIAFADGSLLRIGPSTQVQLSKNRREVAKKSLVLFFGKIWSKITHYTEAGNGYEVKTPNAVCGVRGTEFVTAVADDGTARVSVDQGKVAVQGDAQQTDVESGQTVEADDNAVTPVNGPQNAATAKAWQTARQNRLKTQAPALVARLKDKINHAKTTLEGLRDEEKRLQARQAAAIERAQAGDQAAATEVAQLQLELGRVADRIADLGDAADSQFGIVDHFVDLARQPAFSNINRKMLEAEAASLRRVKAQFDKMVAEGTDISMKAMDSLLDEMHRGKRGTLKDRPGSSAEDLFDE